MKIEIVAFYPANPLPKNSDLIGSLHIFFPEIGIDIRGINVFKRGKRYFFKFPCKIGTNEKKERISYPLINFRDKEAKKTIESFLFQEFSKTFI